MENPATLPAEDDGERVLGEEDESNVASDEGVLEPRRVDDVGWALLD